MTTDSPDVLTDGRWECVRGVWRWVVEESLPVPLARCAECDRGTRVPRRGLCQVCYRGMRRCAV